MGYGGKKENASSEEREMPICGSRSVKNFTFLAARDIVVEVEHVNVAL